MHVGIKMNPALYKGPRWEEISGQINSMHESCHLRSCFFMSAKWQPICLLVEDLQHNFLIFFLTEIWIIFNKFSKVKQLFLTITDLFVNTDTTGTHKVPIQVSLQYPVRWWSAILYYPTLAWKFQGLGCEKNLYFERWNSRTHQPI